MFKKTNSFLRFFVLLFVCMIVLGFQNVNSEEKIYIERGGTRIEFPAGYTKPAYVKVSIDERQIGLIRVSAAARTDGDWQNQETEYEVISKPDFESIIGKGTFVKGPATLIVIQETTVKKDGSISVRMTAKCNTDFKIVEVGVPFAVIDPERWDKSTVSLWDKDQKISEIVLPPTEGLHGNGTLIKIKHPKGGEVSLMLQNQAELLFMDTRLKSWLLGYSLLADANAVFLLAKEEKELFEIDIRIKPVN